MDSATMLMCLHLWVDRVVDMPGDIRIMRGVYWNAHANESVPGKTDHHLVCDLTIPSTQEGYTM